MNATTTMPHAKFIIAISLILLAGFTGVTFWVLIYSNDPTTKGSIIQTWNNLVIAVGSFWLGSSLGGKIGMGQASGKPNDPINVKPSDGEEP